MIPWATETASTGTVVSKTHVPQHNAIVQALAEFRAKIPSLRIGRKYGPTEEDKVH